MGLSPDPVDPDGAASARDAVGPAAAASARDAVGAASGDHLVVEHCGERCRLGPGEDLRFGRAAPLVIDENPFMHRVVGRFVHREGVWWLQNHGSATRLTLLDEDTGSVLEAAPGQQVPVLAVSGTLRFRSGPTTYELALERSGPALEVDELGDVVGTATIRFAEVPLSPEQHVLIVALYDSTLSAGHLEGNSAIARRLGWSANKFNRKLDAICDKLDRAGVPGVKGSPGALAETRREVVLDHALRHGLVGPGDLDLLRAVG